MVAGFRDLTAHIAMTGFVGPVSLELINCRTSRIPAGCRTTAQIDFQTKGIDELQWAVTNKAMDIRLDLREVVNDGM